MDNSTQICPVCTVKINNSVVLYATGKTATEDDLYSRVCQYARKNGCINSLKKVGNKSV